MAPCLGSRPVPRLSGREDEDGGPSQPLTFSLRPISAASNVQKGPRPPLVGVLGAVRPRLSACRKDAPAPLHTGSPERRPRVPSVSLSRPWFHPCCIGHTLQLGKRRGTMAGGRRTRRGRGVPTLVVARSAASAARCTAWLGEQQAARDWCSICPTVLRNSGGCRPATYCRS